MYPSRTSRRAPCAELGDRVLGSFLEQSVFGSPAKEPLTPRFRGEPRLGVGERVDQLNHLVPLEGGSTDRASDEPQGSMNSNAPLLASTGARAFVNHGYRVVRLGPGQCLCLADVPGAGTEDPHVLGEHRQLGQPFDPDWSQPCRTPHRVELAVQRPPDIDLAQDSRADERVLVLDDCLEHIELGGASEVAQRRCVEDEPQLITRARPSAPRAAPR